MGDRALRLALAVRVAQDVNPTPRGAVFLTDVVDRALAALEAVGPPSL